MNPKITIIGRLGSNPEALGSSGVRFRVVTADRGKSENGVWEEKDTSWWTVKAWRSLADQTKVLQKGQEVIVTGTIAQDNWTDSSGVARNSYDITADSIAITTFSLTKTTSTPAERLETENTVDPWAVTV